MSRAESDGSVGVRLGCGAWVGSDTDSDAIGGGAGGRHLGLICDAQCDGRHVGSGDADHVGHGCARLVCGVEHVEAAVVSVLGFAELMIGEQLVETCLGEACDELVGDLLQCQHADAAFANIGGDVIGVRATVTAVQGHDGELSGERGAGGFRGRGR